MNKNVPTRLFLPLVLLDVGMPSSDIKELLLLQELTDRRFGENYCNQTLRIFLKLILLKVYLCWRQACRYLIILLITYIAYEHAIFNYLAVFMQSVKLQDLSLPSYWYG